LTIRLTADGLSFCRTPRRCDGEFFPFGERTPGQALREIVEQGKIVPGDFEHAMVEIDTPRVVLFPNTAWEEGMEENYLLLNNITLAGDETTVLSPSLGVRAAMVAPRDPVEYLAGLWGEEASYSSPLLASIYRKTRGTLELNLTRRHAYITIFGDKLDYAEVFPWEGMADLLYYMYLLEGSHNLRGATISVTGHRAAEATKKLAAYYRGVMK
jgi:hypothetical protein